MYRAIFLPLNKFVIIHFSNIKPDIKWSRKWSSYSREVKKTKSKSSCRINLTAKLKNTKNRRFISPNKIVHDSSFKDGKKSTQLASIPHRDRKNSKVASRFNKLGELNRVDQLRLRGARKRRRGRNRFFSREIEHRVEAELPLPPDPNVRPDRRSSRED